MDLAKVKCSNAGCDHSILPATAARTGGRCMRCVGAEKQARDAEYVRTHRREVDLYAGLSDPVDILLVFHTPRKFDRLTTYRPPPRPVEEIYRALAADQSARLMDAALESIDATIAKDIARSLATLTTHDLVPLQVAWADAGEFRPDVLFRGAPAAVRDAIIAFVEDAPADNSLRVNHALCALAWIGDTVVQETFERWEQRPRPWRETLHVGPNGYARIAGWELRAGRRHNLFHPSCWSIHTAGPNDPPDDRISTFTGVKGECPWCQRSLLHLVVLDLSGLGIMVSGAEPRPRLPVLTCGVCTYFSEYIFARVNSNGQTIWHEANTTPSSLPTKDVAWGDSPWREHRARLARRHGMEAVGDGSIDASQVGGPPAWVQDAAYPTCPDCRQTMTFLSQLDNSRFRGHEGVHYAFLCARCGVTATTYQQT